MLLTLLKISKKKRLVKESGKATIKKVTFEKTAAEKPIVKQVASSESIEQSSSKSSSHL